MLAALVWNVALTAVLAAALTLAGRRRWLRRRPGLLHILWLLVLVKLITPPVVEVPVGWAVALIEESPAERAAESYVGAPIATEEHKTPFAEDAGAMRQQDSRSSAEVGVIPGEEQHPRWRIDAGGLVAVWWLGSAVLASVLIRQVNKWRGLMQLATPATGAAADIVSELADKLGAVGPPQVRIANGVFIPCLWVWGRPVILLPRGLAEGLSEDELRGVIGHELAHFVRRDHWANAFALLVKVLLWWNPTVWWAHRQLRGAQDLCCDALTIGRQGVDRRRYAVTMFKVLEFVQSRPSMAMGPAVGFGAVSPIQERFKMIADTQLTHIVSRRAWLGVLVLAAALLCVPVWGQDGAEKPQPPVTQRDRASSKKPGENNTKGDMLPSLSDEEEQLRKWFDRYDEHAKSWTIHPPGKPGRPFQGPEKPALRYRNYYTLSHGGLYVWTQAGRPEVIAAVWSNIYSGPGKRRLLHEMQSLSLAPFVAKRKGEEVWTPREAGIDLKVIPGEAAPARSRDVRLVQMRELAHRITAFRTERGTEERLRLAAEQPLYRYQESSVELVDGGMFVYFDEDFWDPEVVMILEARRRDGKYKWHVGAGRFTFNPARLEYQGRNLWNAPSKRADDPTGEKFVVTGEIRHSRFGDPPDNFNPLENLQLSEQRLLKFYGADHPITQAIQRMLRSAQAELRARGEEIRKLEPAEAETQKPEGGKPKAGAGRDPYRIYDNDKAFNMNCTRIDFEKSPDGKPLEADTDITRTFAPVGCIFESLSGSCIGITKFNVGGRSRGKSAANMDPLYQGVIRIKFCRPGDPKTSATVTRVGMWVSHVMHDGTSLVAYNAAGKHIAKATVSRERKDFLGLISKVPIGYVELVPNLDIDPDFAIDDLVFDRPKPTMR